MKRGLILLLCLALVASILPVGALAQEEDVLLPWLSYTLHVKSVEDSPPHIEGNPPPVAERYLILTFAVMDGKADIFDVVDNFVLFVLRGPADEIYRAAAYFPRSIMFLAAAGIFSTAPTQSVFEILFVIPADMPLSDLTLVVEESLGTPMDSVPLSEIPLLGSEL